MSRLGVSLCVLCFAPDARAATIDDARRHHLAGRYDEALAAYSEVAAKLEQSDPATAAAAYNNSCLILIDRGEHQLAIDRCRAALRLRRGLNDERRLARASNNLGLALQRVGRFGEAREAFLEALTLNRRIDETEAQVINLGNLGALARQSGQYGRAMQRHAEAVALTDLHAEQSWAASQRSIAKINQGAVLGQLGADREALELYREVLRDDAALHPRRHAALQVNLGVAYRNLGDPIEAQKAFLEATRIFEQFEDQSGLSNALLNLGLTQHLNFEDFESAERSFLKALALARDTGDHAEEIQDLFYLGQLYLDQNRLSEASEFFEACLTLATESDSAEGLWSALDGLGRVAEARGDRKEALDYLQRAMGEIEQVRAGLTPGSQRSGFFGDKRPIYDAAVRVLVSLADGRETGEFVDEALRVVQTAKARELLEALGAGESVASSAKPAVIQQTLGQTTILEYFIAEGQLYLWVIDRSQIRLSPLGPAAPILELVGRLHAGLARGHRPEATVLRQLSRRLLEPVGELPRAVSRLVIAPDGGLHYLPFELLADPGDRARSILDRVPVSYLPSASARVWLAERTVGVAETVICFGNPVLGGDLKAADASWAASLALKPLRASEDELAAIARWLPGERELRVGAEATEEAFRTLVAQGAKVVHLATHSVVDERRAGHGAAILLSPSESDDGLLYPREIATLEYEARLTVIAACRTALGSIEDGRALASLTGAFLAAGSSAVLATLWDVADGETAAFMEQFYYFLGRGLEPAKALRRTKRRLRADARWERPSLWAGYVLIGEAPPLARHSIVPRWALLFAALLAIVGVGVGFRRAKHKKA